MSGRVGNMLSGRVKVVVDSGRVGSVLQGRTQRCKCGGGLFPLNKDLCSHLKRASGKRSEPNQLGVSGF